VSAEVVRAWQRRLVRVFLFLGAVAAIVAGFLSFLKSESMDDAAFRSQRQVAESIQRDANQRLDECLRSNAQSGSEAVPAPPKECFGAFRFPHIHDRRFHWKKLAGILQGTAGVLALAGWVLGASLIGAEFSSRALTTTMTFEAGRVRLFVAKSAAAIVVAAVATFVVLLAMAIALLPAAVFHGAPATGEPGVATMLGIGLRGAAMAAIAAGIGFAVASVGRNTAAALGGGFAYIIVIENIIGSTIARWRRWLLLGNAIVFVSGKDQGGDVFGRSVTEAGVFLSAVAFALLLGGLTVFRTRDLA